MVATLSSVLSSLNIEKKLPLFILFRNLKFITKNLLYGIL